MMFQVPSVSSALSANFLFFLFSFVSLRRLIEGSSTEERNDKKKRIIMEECIENKITSVQCTMGERVH